MPPPIVLFDDPRLTTVSSQVDLNSADDAAVIRMVGQYAEMLPSPIVSAPLFGINKRLVLIRHNNRPLPVFNPVMLEARDFSYVNELCWPSLQEFRLRTRRPKYVSIQATVLDGSAQSLQVAGENAQSLHWHLELLNGTAPICRMTPFQQYLACRSQYFRERNPFHGLMDQMLKLADNLPATNEPYLKFDGEYEFTAPSMLKLEGCSDSFKIDMRDPFGCLSDLDQTLLQIFTAHHNQEGFSLFQVGNPMLIVAANLISPKDRVVSVSDDAGKHIAESFCEGSLDQKILLVSNRLEDLSYRNKPNSIFMDWCWSSNNKGDIENTIRAISKKMPANGVLYFACRPKKTKKGFEEDILKKIFPRVDRKNVKDGFLLAGYRSPSESDGVLRMAENLVPLPWKTMT